MKIVEQTKFHVDSNVMRRKLEERKQGEEAGLQTGVE